MIVELAGLYARLREIMMPLWGRKQKIVTKASDCTTCTCHNLRACWQRYVAFVEVDVTRGFAFCIDLAIHICQAGGETRLFSLQLQVPGISPLTHLLWSSAREHVDDEQ